MLACAPSKFLSLSVLLVLSLYAGCASHKPAPETTPAQDNVAIHEEMSNMSKVMAELWQLQFHPPALEADVNKEIKEVKEVKEVTEVKGAEKAEGLPSASKPTKQDNRNEKRVKELLTKLLMEFRMIKGHIEHKDVVARLTYKLMVEQLEYTKNAYSGPDRDFGKTLIGGISGLCMTCHEADTKNQKFFHNHIKLDGLGPFQVAEFYYMTRDYPNAEKFYKTYLSLPNPPKEDHAQFIRAAKRLLSIYVRIQERPDLAKTFIQECAQDENKKSKFAKYSDIDLATWENDLNFWIKRDKFKTAKFKVKDISKFIKLYGSIGVDFKNPEATLDHGLVFLRFSGLLSQLLAKNQPVKGKAGFKESDLPVVLYWLAIAERNLDFSYFYSLANSYLQYCITQFPKHPYAKKCYNEYKEQISLGYTGSQGTDIPEDIAQKLIEYRKLLELN